LLQSCLILRFPILNLLNGRSTSALGTTLSWKLSVRSGRAEKVRTVSAQIEWVERFCTSSKTHPRHELSGFVGECTHEWLREMSLKCQMLEFLRWLASAS
jgi:hypothetical protein